MGAVLAGHLGDPRAATTATADADPAVRAAGYGALARLGRWDLAVAARGLADPDPTVRRRACELSGRHGRRAPGPAPTRDHASGPTTVRGLVAAVLRCLDDPDPAVVEMAAWALGELVPDEDDRVDQNDRVDEDDRAVSDRSGGGTGSCGEDEHPGCSPGHPPDPGSTLGARLRSEQVTVVGALGAVARSHADPLAREAAVAALGAIGDPAGLDAVLHALGGRPPLRRRAAVALAAFDDPRAEGALTGCLQDRDWQVREVAEELLGHPPAG